MSSFENTLPYLRPGLLNNMVTSFNIILNDELDNYKHTNVILYDVQRDTSNNQNDKEYNYELS